MSYNPKNIEAMNAARRAQSVVPHADRPSIAREYLETDITYRELGERYEVGGEWICQIIREHDPSIPQRRKARRRQEQAETEAVEVWVKFWKRCRSALAENRRCKTCDGWIIRGGKGTITCSTECFAAYNVLRIFDDPDSHRRALAKVYLRSPEKYKGSSVEWAKRMLGPNPPERNRTYLIPGSERAEVIKKYRPEAYAELLKEIA